MRPEVFVVVFFILLLFVISFAFLSLGLETLQRRLTQNEEGSEGGDFSSLPWRTLLSDHWSMIELSPSEPIRIMKSVGDVCFLFCFFFLFLFLSCSSASLLHLLPACPPGRGAPSSHWLRLPLCSLIVRGALGSCRPRQPWTRPCWCGRLLALEHFFLFSSSDDLKKKTKTKQLSTDHVKQFRCIDVPSMHMPPCMWLAIKKK